MINFDHIYEDNSAELIEVQDYELGKTYITEDGTRIKFLGIDNGAFKFKVINGSPMVGGEKVSTFEHPSGLKLFWRLLNKGSNEDTD
jgi:hypothetical protein